MPELDDLLQSESARYEPVVPDFESLLTTARARLRRRRTLAVVALAAAVIVIGAIPTLIHLKDRGADSPVAPSPAISTSAPADSLPAGYRGPSLRVRTDPDDKGLVASYVGGACDNPARLVAAETVSRIDIGVVFSGPKSVRACIAIGISRTLGVRLATAVDGRPIYSNGRQIIPFDGKRLLTPSYLPAGFSVQLEEGSDYVDPAPASAQPASAGPSATSVPEVDVITEWTRNYSAPPKPDTGNHCTPGSGFLTVTQSPLGSVQGSEQWKSTGTEKVGSATARILQQTYPDVDGWLVTWPASGGTVTVSTVTGCPGDKIPDLTEVLKVARSLH